MKNKILLALLIISMFCSLSVICAQDNGTVLQEDSQIQNSIDYEIKSTDSSSNDIVSSSTNDNNINEVSSVKSNKKTINYTKNNIKEATLNSSKSLKTSGNEYYFNSSVTKNGDGSKNNPWNKLNQTNFNSITNGSTVYIANGKYTVDDLNISINVKIIGENVNNTIITSSWYADNTFNISSVVTISNITFNDTKTTTMENHDNLTLNNCIFKNNRMWRYYSAGITNYGNLTLNKCIFNNISSYWGSAIDHEGDSPNIIAINNCIFDYCGFNSTSSRVGTLYFKGVNASITGCNFTSNYGYYSGAIYNSNSNLTISNSTFKDNGVSTTKHLLYSYNGTLYVSNTTFTNNTSLYGTINSTSGILGMNTSAFIGNKATYMGGAMYLWYSNASITSTRFINNSATNGTGGVFFVYDSNLAVNNSVFDNNYALLGAVGTFLNGSAYFRIIELEYNSSFINSTFTNNKAYYDGGVFYDVYSNLTIKSSNFTNNSARNGGVIYADYLVLDLDRNNFENNTAKKMGGAIYTNQINLKLTNNNFTNNKAANASDIYVQYSESFNQSNNKQSNANSIITSTIITTSTPKIIVETLNDTYNGSLPSSYDLRELNQVTSVKSQGSEGNCWAFAAMATLESCLLKATGISYDFSENNLKNIAALFSESARYLLPNDGGMATMAIAYLVNWYGPISEEDEAYEPELLISPKIDNLLQINNIYAIPSRTNFTDNDLVKQAIMKYGGVYTAIGWSSSYLNSKTDAYYYNANKATNHAVCIVGWDDNYSASNFKTQPAGDGAYIIKNSWGANVGDNGYYYVSYYDTSILNSCNELSYAGGFTFILNDTVSYDRVYQYDVGGLSSWMTRNGYHTYYSNEFVSCGNDYIKAFGTYVCNTSLEYTAKVYVNGVLQHTQSGKFSHLGYETVKLTKAIPVRENDSMKILLEFPAFSTVHIPISYGYYTRVISTNNSLINDYSYDNEIVCLKLYTESAQQSQINATVSKINATGSQIIVTVKDLEGNYLNNGTIIIYDNDEKINTMNISNNPTYLNLNLSKGTHNITVVYDSTSYFSSNSSVIVTIGSTSINSSVLNNTVKNTTVKVVITDIDNNKIPSGTINIYDKTNTLLAQTTFTNGETTVQLTLPSGNQELFIVYLGDNTYLSSNTTQNVNVEKLNTTITVDKTQMKINKTGTITITLTDETQDKLDDKTVTVNINGTNLTSTTNANGVVTFNYVPLHAGEYTVVATFNGDDSYISSTDTTKFTVDKLNTSITISNVDSVIVSNKVAIKITLSDEDGNKLVGKTVILTVDGNNQSITTDSDGLASYNYTASTTGDKSIIARYDGESDYNSSQSTSTITVNPKIVTSLSVQATDTKINKTTVITVVLTDEYNAKLSGKTVNITINGVTLSNVTNGNGVATFSYVSSRAGEYVVNAKFNEDNTYASSSGSATFSVDKLNTRITISTVDSVIISNKATIKVTLTDEDGALLAGKVINLTVGNDSATVTTGSNGVASYDYTGTTVGDKSIVARYGGESVYNGSQSTSTITVNPKIVTNLDVQAQNTKINKTTTIVVTLTDVNGVNLSDKTVNVTVDGQTFTNITDSNGVATFSYTSSKAGDYIVNAKFNEDSTYASSSASATFGVSKLGTNVVVSSVDSVIVSNKATIKVTLTDEDGVKLSGKAVVLTVDGNNHSIITDGNGVASYDYTPSTTGDKGIIAKYEGDSVYNGSQSTSTITVNSKIVTNLNVQAVDTKINKTTVITVTLTDVNGVNLSDKTVNVTVDGQTFTNITDSNGVATFNYTSSKAGDYIVNAKFNEDSTYASSSGSATFSVDKLNTRITISNVDSMIIEGKTQINVTLTDEDGVKLSGKTVNLTVGDVITTVTTGGDGVATYEYTTTSIGDKSIVARYGGDSVYNSNQTTSIITVTSKKLTNLDIQVENTKINKTTTINVTLADENSTKLVGKTINLTINGETFTNTTNNKGIATFNYMPTQAGEFNVVAKFGEDDTYASSSGSATFSVDKLNTSITVSSVDSVIVGNKATIKVTLTDEDGVKLSGKTVVLTVDGNDQSITTDNDGIATYEYVASSEGKKSIIVKYEGESDYNGNQTISSITVTTKIVTKLDVQAQNTKINKTTTVTVALTDENNNQLADKYVTVTINDTTLTNKTDNEGIATFSYTPVCAGEYDVVVSFNGDTYYVSSNNSTKFNVDKLNTNIVISNDESMIVGNKATIKVTLTDDDGNLLADKLINLTVGNYSTNITTDNEGVASYEYTGTSIGDKSIVARYGGDSVYAGNQSTSTITVTSKIVTKLDVQVDDTRINKTTAITVTLSDVNGVNLSGKAVVLTVDGQTFNSKTNENGVVKFNYTSSKTGEFSVVAIFDGDDTFEGSENSTVLVVDKLSTSITTKVVNSTPKCSVVNATLVDENGNGVSNTLVVIKDKNNVTLCSNLTDNEGFVKFNIGLSSGVNNLIVSYSGSDSYSSSNASVSVTVPKMDTKISLPDYDMYIFDYSNITVNVTDEYGNPVNGGYLIFKVNGVTLKSNGKFYSQETNPMKFNVVNGKATIVFNATSFYNKKYVHSMIVKYSGTTSQYNSASSTTKTLKINKRIGYMTVTTDKSSYNLYETVNIMATYYDITHGNATPIYSDQSCYAIYKINGITSKVNGSNERFAINNSQVLIGNNSKSQINYIHIDHTAPNKKEYHTIEVKTHNEYYTTLVGNTTITLNKSPTHIDINSVTYNKTSNKITISANIKDYKNNNTKGVNYYSVKINGVTYKANGQTTFNTTGGNIEMTINSTTKNIRNIELVTREKLAYEGSRNTTTNIQTVK